MVWQAGQKVLRPFSPESGIGVVVGVDDRFLDVFFPDTMERLQLSPEPESVRAIVLGVGMLVRAGTQGVEQIVEKTATHATLSNGEVVALEDLWPVMASSGLGNRLLDANFDDTQDVLNRMDGLRLLSLQHSRGLASLMGARIDLFAHQLHTALQAIGMRRVRWLLADEVGLGKTIVAHMIASSLLRTGRIERVIILAPEALVVQWLGELYKKFHQAFVYIDEERVGHVATDFGPEVNPFDVHPLAVMSYEFLQRHPKWAKAMEASNPQMIIADEAHRVLTESLGEVTSPLIKQTPHALLLTATPFQLGAEGFMHFVRVLDLPVQGGQGGPTIVRQVSSVGRQDIKRLPARQPQAVAVTSVVEGAISLEDERVQWLVEHLKQWKADKQRALIFVNDAARAQRLSDLLARATHHTLFCFHEHMDTQQRDIELSLFKLSASPAMVTSGAGSEGRNFQFCDVLVHFDLPRDPTVLEQRIGRLDRIGRTGDIPIVYFTHEGASGQLATFYEELGLFEQASVGASDLMHKVRVFLEQSDPSGPTRDALVQQVRGHRVSEDVSWVFPDSHQQEQDAEIMGQVPWDLDELMERFCTDAAGRVGLDLVEKDKESTYSFEYGSNVVVDAIPGLSYEAHFLGTFDREEAIRSQELDFFSYGHAVVQGLLSELEDSTQGAVGALQLKPRDWAHYAPEGWGVEGVYVLLHEGAAAHHQQVHKLMGVAGARQGEALKLDGEQLRSILECSDDARSVRNALTQQIARAFEFTAFDERVGLDGEPRFALVLVVGA